MSIPPSYPGQPYPEGQQPAPMYYPVPQKPATNGLGVAAMVLGIVGILTCLVPVLGLILGVVAVILGILGMRKKNSTTGMAITGLILGGLATLVGIGVLIFTIMLAGKVAETMPAQLSASVSSEAGGQVTYTSLATATASSSNSQGAVNDTITGKSWNKEITVHGFDGIAVVVDAADPTDTVTCKIVVKDKTLAEETGTGSVSCSAANFGN